MAMTGPNGRVVQERSLWEQADSGNGCAAVGWSEVDAELLHKAIVLLTEDGSAITLGMTSDGGALMVAVLNNGKAFKSYFHEVKHLEDKLAALIKLA